MSLIFCGKPAVFISVAVGVLCSAADRDLSGQTRIVSGSPFGIGAGTHETRGQSQNPVQLPKEKEIGQENKIVLPPRPTRSSFMATWPAVRAATRYLLDVSTSISFTDFVDGYHDLDVGNATRRVVTGLRHGTTYYYRVRAYDVSGRGCYATTMAAATESTSGLTIHPTFDSSIINHPDSTAIQASIIAAISIYELLFTDPITIEIRFRYSTTEPNGDPLPAGRIAQSVFVYYTVPWETYIDGLRADAKTANDNLAGATLPASDLSANLLPSSAAGRAVGLDTPPALFADGTVGVGGPYDGIVTLNSSSPYQFIRPPSSDEYDAQRSFEHEMDEVIGLGSHLNVSGSDLRPQDLFSWSSSGQRNTTSSGTRYFSIDGGITNIVSFNQTSAGDFGDWLSEQCPQSHPYVQNAFACTGQSSDVAATSPEGVNLDVIGYDLSNPPTPTPTPVLTPTPVERAVIADFNSDSYPDLVVQNVSTHQTVTGYFNNNIVIDAAFGPTLPGGWRLAGAADFDGDGSTDYVLFNPTTGQTVIAYLSGVTVIGAAYGPTVPAGWQLVRAIDFNGDAYPDYLLYSASSGQTVIGYLNNTIVVGAAFGPAIPPGWNLIDVADFDNNGDPDYVLLNSHTGQTVIGYLSGPTVIGAAFGPSIPLTWPLAGTGDFDQDGNPDYMLYNPVSGQTAIAYLVNTIVVTAASGPTLPAGWSIFGW